MSYVVLARKWRPQRFEEVIGQNHITTTLRNAISSGRIAHAFLFAGSRGVGKTSVARILAKALNCEQGTSPDPCDQCLPCQEITAGNSLDVQEIDGASNTGVDDVRELRENIKYTPSRGKYRIYIIDEVHMLSTSAFNALLKILEEPPAHAIFVFATTEPHRIPETIISRCQRFDFRRIPQGVIRERLKEVLSQEGVELSEQGLVLISKEAEGSMRDALSLLDQIIAYAGKDIPDDKVIEVLGVADRKLLFEASLAVLERDAQSCLEISNKVYNYGYDIKQFGKELLEHFRNLLVVKVAQNPERLLDLTVNEIEELREQGGKLGLEEILQLFNILLKGEEEIARSPYPKLILELTLVKMAQVKKIYPLEELLQKISKLEMHLGGAAPIPSPVSSGDGMGTAESRAAEERGELENDTWNGLVEFTRNKKPMLASLLEKGKLLGLSQKEIKIGFPENSIFKENLQDADNLNTFDQICRDFFHRELKIKFSALSPEDCPPPREERIKEKNREREMEMEARNDPMVREALNIFGGKITEVKLGTTGREK
ncbi:MAG: DNA polymerase III subunit gamma/tau [Deltaproteobacteria bacterium]|nr:MAG: DNA polymerase III subunit gamma/tau [Deltaproteobacteria bacterium]